MAEFSFCPDRQVPETLVRDTSNTVTMNGWLFSARPTSVMQPRYRVRLFGLKWYLNTDDTYNNSTNPTFNARALEEFYAAHETWKSFGWKHPHLGWMSVKFASPLSVPAAAPNQDGMLEPLEVNFVYAGTYSPPVIDPTAGYSFYFDPRAGKYRDSTALRSTLASMTGYNYTRIGEQGQADASGVVSWFAQNVPVVNSAGYDALGGFSNTTLQSQDFTSASWTKTNVTVTANTAVAPDGTTTMDKVIPSAVNAVHSVRQNVSFFSGSVYTTSVVAKAAEWTKLELYASPGSALGAVFDVQNGTVVTTSGCSAYIVPLSGGTYRCVIVYTASATASNVAEARPRNSNTFNGTDLGDGVGGVHFWQMQTIDRAWVAGGPYLRTTTGTANTGTTSLLMPGALSLAAASSFVLYVVLNLKNLASARSVLTMDNGTTAARASLEINTNGSITVYGDNSSIGAETPTVPLTTGRMVLALRRDGGKWKRYSRQNGNVFVGADTTWGLSATLTQMNIGSGVNNQTFGTIEFIGIKSGSFTDAEITAMMATL